MTAAPGETAAREASGRRRFGRFSTDPWVPFKWTLGVVTLGILDGPVGLVVGVVIGIELALEGTGRRLLALAAVGFASVMLWDLWRGLPSQESVSARWVLDNPVANHLAFAGFAFLVAGLLCFPSVGRGDDDGAVHGRGREGAAGR